MNKFNKLQQNLRVEFLKDEKAFKAIMFVNPWFLFSIT